MSVIKFELKKEHIKLLRQLRWSTTSDKKTIISVDNVDEPLLFNENNVYEAIDMILNGKPPKFDPMNTYELTEYPPEQIKQWDELLSELPMALDIILYNGHFNCGLYKTKFHLRDWKLIENKLN